MARKNSIDTVGVACLSHSNRSSNTNTRYHSMEFRIIEEIYEDYWEKLRENVFAELTKNAIAEQVEELKVIK